MASDSITPKKNERLGFESPDFSWAEYIKDRPVYHKSFYDRIYKHHAEHSNSWKIAHDVGAGAGIASQELANSFERVIVSDPSDEYIKYAAARLARDFTFPDNKFSFLTEMAEMSSVKEKSVDLLVIFEAIHWTDIPTAINGFARQLKSGGTVAISLYFQPLILENDPAQQLLNDIFSVYVKKRLDVSSPASKVSHRAMEAMYTSLNCVSFPTENWEAGVKRININFCGKPHALSIPLPDYPKNGPDNSREDDQREEVENDPDWIEERGLGSLKGIVSSFQPDFEEGEISELWGKLENVIGNGKKVKIAWPVVQLLATRR